jgi:chaperonin GroEL (HSP60 family)
MCPAEVLWELPKRERQRRLRTALQDAASIAGLLITTEAMVAEKPKKAAPPAPPPMDY